MRTEKRPPAEPSPRSGGRHAGLTVGSWPRSSLRLARPHPRAHQRSAGSPSEGSHEQDAERAPGSPSGTAGRPGWRRAYVQRLRTSWRCQPNRVSGRTKNDRRLVPLRSRLAAARKTRSVSSRRGRATWRRRTASSCRSTTISSSLNSRERQRSAATASARRNNRYTSDTTKSRLPPPEHRRGPLYDRQSRSRNALLQQIDLRTHTVREVSVQAPAARRTERLRRRIHQVVSMAGRRCALRRSSRSSSIRPAR